MQGGVIEADPLARRRLRPPPAATRLLRILTLNLGLNGLRAGRRFAIASHIEARLAAAPDQVAALDADIIALQEVYDRRDRRFLVQQLRHSHPFAFAASARLSLYGNGLLFLSRLPIRSGRFVPVRAAAPPTRWLSEQGFLLAEIGADGMPPLRFVNVHLLASEPLGRPNPARRMREIKALLALGRQQGAILLGDFNTSPVVAPDLYAALLAAGYSDAFAAANGAGEEPTWDAGNLLNRTGMHHREPSQRIDHVFVPHGLRGAIGPHAAAVVLRQPCVALPDGVCCTVSDHYGLLVTLAR